MHHPRSSLEESEEKLQLLAPAPDSAARSARFHYATSRSRRSQWTIVILSCLLLASLAHQYTRREGSSPAQVEVEACSADAFNSGIWQKKPFPVDVTDQDSLYAANQVTGCAAQHYYYSHVGTSWADYNGPASWEWQPSEACQLERPSAREKLQKLVDDGGLLLVGDSLSYLHFYQLSCELYPHVRWEGISIDPVIEEGFKGRKQLQHLYLVVGSPLVEELNLPVDFDMERPVISWYSTWWPASINELRQQPGVNLSIVPADYDDNAIFNVTYRQPSSVPIDYFVNPSHRYRTMLVSFGAHIGPHAFHHDPNWVELQSLLRVMMRIFYRNLQAKMSPDQRVIVRASPPGHDISVHYDGPEREMPEPGNHWQWRLMPLYNILIRGEMAALRDRRFFWMDGERISRTRPDAHIKGDGLHYAYGTGVFEAFSKYMWHLLAVQ